MPAGRGAHGNMMTMKTDTKLKCGYAEKIAP